ncbi:zinc finger protein 90-like isoform X3 [Phlebotomus papatasi]|nr:zinc finger protein 90-like isoform X3 [Phlebotomus papatasi]
MRSEIDFFLLKHRVFLVKHFYQYNGDSLCVKTKYETNYKNCNDSPKFSCDVLVEIVNLFEQTGSVFRPLERALETTCQQQIEQIYVKVEDPEEESDNDVEELDFLNSPLPPEHVQLNAFDNSNSDIYNSSQESISDADTLSNEEFPLIHGFKNKREGELNDLPEWWENSDDSVQATDLEWFENRPNQEGEFLNNPNNNIFPFKCSFSNCQKAFKSSIALKLHRISHPVDRDKIYKCQKCNKVFLRKYALKRHYKLKHLPLKYKCQKCGCGFRQDKNYRNHLEDHHGEEDVDFFDEPPPTSPVLRSPSVSKKLYVNRPSNERYFCGNCSQEFNRKFLVSSHDCSNKNMKQCSECRLLILKSELDEHLLYHKRKRIKGNSVGESGIICDICGKWLKLQRSLEPHIKKCHNKTVLKFKCKAFGCDRSYPNEKFLKRHMDRHKGKIFSCDLCNFDYKDKQYLKIHMAKHHLKSDAPFKCSECGRPFWIPRLYRSHMHIIHNIDVPYFRKKRQTTEETNN